MNDIGKHIYEESYVSWPKKEAKESNLWKNIPEFKSKGYSNDTFNVLRCSFKSIVLCFLSL